jgi:hypothetical protein
VDPAVTNTVSNFKVSAVIVTLASPDVIKESFRQEKMIRSRKESSIGSVFIVSKNKAKCRKLKKYNELRDKSRKGVMQRVSSFSKKI